MEGSVHALVPKRPREETQSLKQEAEAEAENSSQEPFKRHKPYTHILSLLESDEDDPTQDLSPLITTLQQEIASSASDSQSLLTPDPNHNHDHDHDHYHPPTSVSEEGVIRHLLEASDDELGIPNTGTSGNIGLFDFGEGGFNNNGGDYDGFYSLCDGLWELEDETANYYALLQSELFM